MNKRIELVQRVELIKELSAGKKVLHLGCTNWPYTEDAIAGDMLMHFELERIASEIYGFDYDQEGIDILAARGSKNLFQADLEKLEKVPLDQTFDVIVAGEVIEHLNNPGLFLNGIKRFMNTDTQLIVTTINAYCGMRFFQYGLRGRGGLSEPVHPDHVAYYSYSTLGLLLKRHDLDVENFYFYDIGHEHRPHNRPALNIINDICVRITPQLADGIIAVCKLPNAELDS
jgi:SAM-dependent methyltransferase